MMRIVSVVSVAGLLVSGGMWLSQNTAAVDGDVQMASANTSASSLWSRQLEATPREDSSSDIISISSEPLASAQLAPEMTSGLDSIELPLGFDLVSPLADTPVQSFESAEFVLEPDLDYQALLVTNRGTMRFDLFQDQTPETVNNMVFLALHRYYDGIVFHRVLDGFMAQTGDPTGTGRGGPGYQFGDEIVPELSHDAAGVLSMANAGPGTNGSQFFITFTETSWLDGRHTVFGRIIEGLDVLNSLQRIDPQNPSAIALVSEPLERVQEQGISLGGSGDTMLEDYITSSLGALPAVGQTFELDGFSGIVGRMGDDMAVGFFPAPDFIENMFIIAR